MSTDDGAGQPGSGPDRPGLRLTEISTAAGTTGSATRTSFAPESVARIAVALVGADFLATEGQTRGYLTVEASLIKSHNAPQAERVMASSPEETGMSTATQMTDGSSMALVAGNLRARAPIEDLWIGQNDLGSLAASAGAASSLVGLAGSMEAEDLVAAGLAEAAEVVATDTLSTRLSFKWDGWGFRS